MAPNEFKSTVAALAVTVMISLPAVAVAQEAPGEGQPGESFQVPKVPGPVAPDAPEEAETDTRSLIEDLAQADSAAAADRIEREIFRQWSKSGSPAMDLLLKRGRDALEVDKVDVALEHLRALTDHAPEFAEGWHTLALAYYQAEMYGPTMDALEHTLALNPDHFGALRGVAAIHEQTGDPARAYEAYARVREMRPHDEAVISAMERLAPEVQGIDI
ncbi:hypothetical protein [Salipiger mucosus]|nr:hypothetical protein [Salipiger mucosus]